MGGFTNLHLMTPALVVVSKGYAHQFDHTDTCRDPFVLPPSDGQVSRCHHSTFLVLSPEYRIKLRSGSAYANVRDTRFDVLLLSHGDLCVVMTTSRHHGMPPPHGLPHQGVMFTRRTMDKQHRHIVKNATHLDRVLVPGVKTFMGALDQHTVPTSLLVLWLGRGIARTVGLDNKDMVGTIFDPEEPGRFHLRNLVAVPLLEQSTHCRPPRLGRGSVFGTDPLSWKAARPAPPKRWQLSASALAVFSHRPAKQPHGSSSTLQLPEGPPRKQNRGSCLSHARMMCKCAFSMHTFVRHR